MGKKPWKGAAVYFNPEVSGGKGLSFASGVAGALNGETYRVGAVEPAVFVARAYLQQYIALGNTKYEEVADGINQVPAKIPVNRITISAGKFAIANFYDDNIYSKDPRSQFFNCSLWANGAWDYPANTRGYTMGLVVELFKANWALRISSVAVPAIANYHKMEYNIHAHSETFEVEHTLLINARKGKIRLMASGTHSRAPSYLEGLKAIANNNVFMLNVFQGNAENNKYGGTKYSGGLNIEQALSNEIGVFTRVGWNDGKYSSWAFTEIDHTLNIGLSVKGDKWFRPQDVCGIAIVINCIFTNHRNFLRAGGYGFIIGDGTLNYSNEKILETYDNAALSKNLWLTIDWKRSRLIFLWHW